MKNKVRALDKLLKINKIERDKLIEIHSRIIEELALANDIVHGEEKTIRNLEQEVRQLTGGKQSLSVDQLVNIQRFISETQSRIAKQKEEVSRLEGLLETTSTQLRAQMLQQRSLEHCWHHAKQRVKDDLERKFGKELDEHWLQLRSER